VELLFAAVFLPTFILVLSSLVLVGGQEIAVLERRWFGLPLPEGRVVAMAEEIGVQARILGPGMHWLFPFLYRVKKHPMLRIAEDEVGMVEAIDGQPIPPGPIFADVVEGHNLFQDGEAFLRQGGEKGPQLQVLPPGIYRLNPFLFRVTRTPVTVVGSNHVGVVAAADGQPISPGRLLGRCVEGHDNFQNAQAFLARGGQKGPQLDLLLPGTYRLHTGLFTVSVRPATVIAPKQVGLVNARDGAPLPENEYVAKSLSPQLHRDFQDPSAFLASGGQRGPQLDFLKPGTYYLNPLMFDVTLDEVALVQRGEVAVIVSNIGADPRTCPLAAPDVEGPIADGVERYVVDAGYRGIQREVVGPGTYYLNKLAFTPHLISTTNTTIDWAEGKRDERGPLFNPLAVVSRDGFELSVEVKVIIRVLPQQAPHMVARIGTIENLIEHVIHPLIDSSFRNQASSTEAMKFMQDRHEEQRKAEQHVRAELARYHVECVSVLICQIILPERLMQTLTNMVVATQQKSMYDAQQEAEGRRREMEKTRAQADLQPSLVRAEIDVAIATEQKQQAITLAEGRGQATRLEQEGVAAGIDARGRAEGEKVRAIGKATAEAYQQQAGALGAAPLSIIEVMRQVAAGQVKITPEVLVQGGANGSEGAGGNVLAAFIASLMAQQHTPALTAAAPAPGSAHPPPLIRQVAAPNSAAAKVAP
jgi:regulator of protease activity HflC (stomatin/prohibitin superfamily)